MAEAAKIIYTETDEAPALATHSLLPILQAFTKGTGIELETWDISLSGRIVANFPDKLTEEQRIPDYLRMCGGVVPGVHGEPGQTPQHQRLHSPAEIGHSRASS